MRRRRSPGGVWQAFSNHEDLDFDAAEAMTALQEWRLPEEIGGPDGLEFETRLSKFQGVQHLTLFFPDNAGGDVTRIGYIGLRGLCDAVVRRSYITLAEFAANPADHKKLASGAPDAESAQHGY